MRDNSDITRAIELHSNTVLRVCTLYFGTRPEREDAFQDTFLKYAQSPKEFQGEEHRKAWLINVATNTCKDMLRRSESKTVLMDQIDEAAKPSWQSVPGSESGDSPQSEMLVEALQKLDDKYRTALYLKYFEGYTASEISIIMGIPENTVYTNLARGRDKLKGVLTAEGMGLRVKGTGDLTRAPVKERVKGRHMTRVSNPPSL